MKCIHPRKNDMGGSVEIAHPSAPSDLASWDDATKIASVVPDHPMPPSVCGVAIRSWADAPRDSAGWERLAERIAFDEPPFKARNGKNAASGAVVLEEDGRVWVVSPTNRFGGYTNTFPKGTHGAGSQRSLRANAMKEVFEESGIQAELFGFLVDSERSMSRTRYYVARRLSGNPADMGWESQAVHLVPRELLAGFVSHKNDKAVIEALAAKFGLRSL